MATHSPAKHGMNQHLNYSIFCTPLFFLVVVQLGLYIGPSAAFAQSTPFTTTAGTGGAIPAITAPSQWSELDSTHQQALSPLKNNWPELSDMQRRKWIAIVKNFSTLTPEDQTKLQERMSAWARLNPQERERARENFANSKLAKPTGKADSWEEYRALPQIERDKLASQNNKKRPSAAKSPKPIAPTSLGSTSGIPHARSSTEERNDLRDLITPDTLLPRTLQRQTQ